MSLHIIRKTCIHEYNQNNIKRHEKQRKNGIINSQKAKKRLADDIAVTMGDSRWSVLDYRSHICDIAFLDFGEG